MRIGWSAYAFACAWLKRARAFYRTWKRITRCTTHTGYALPRSGVALQDSGRRLLTPKQKRLDRDPLRDPSSLAAVRAHGQEVRCARSSQPMTPSSCLTIHAFLFRSA